MKNGKTLTLYTTPHGFLMALWRNLFKEQKDLEVLKMPFVLLQKGEHWVGCTRMAHVSPRKGIPFEGLLAQFETRKIFRQIKIESERASMALLRFMASLCGVLVLVCAILICVLLLLLLVIVKAWRECFARE